MPVVDYNSKATHTELFEGTWYGALSRHWELVDDVMAHVDYEPAARRHTTTALTKYCAYCVNQRYSSRKVKCNDCGEVLLSSVMDQTDVTTYRQKAQQKRPRDTTYHGVKDQYKVSIHKDMDCQYEPLPVILRNPASHTSQRYILESYVWHQLYFVTKYLYYSDSASI